MKKVLMSLMVVAVVTAMIGGGLFAHFTDTEQSIGNTFTAGTVDIEIDDGMGYENPWAGPHMTLVDMKPCIPYWDILIIHNCGNNPVRIWKHLAFEEYIEKGNIYPTDAPVASSEPEYEAEGGPAAWGKVEDIDTQIAYAMVIAKKEDPENPGTYIWGDSAEDFDTSTEILGAADPGTNDLIIVDPPNTAFTSLMSRWCQWIGPWVLNPCDVLIIAQLYHLQQPDNVNVYQGDGVQFTVEFYSEQAEGPVHGPPTP